MIEDWPELRDVPGVRTAAPKRAAGWFLAAGSFVVGFVAFLLGPILISIVAGASWRSANGMQDRWTARHAKRAIVFAWLGTLSFWVLLMGLAMLGVQVVPA